MAVVGAVVVYAYLMRSSGHLADANKRLLSILFVGVMLTSATLLVLSGEAQTKSAPAKSVTYLSDFGHGYATGWFIQAGTSPSGTIYLTTDGSSRVLGASANKGTGILVFYNGGEDWSNVSITATLKWVNGSQFSLNFRHEITVSTHSHYSLRFDFGGGTLQFIRQEQTGSNPPTQTALGAPVTFSLARNVWYTVGISANGGALSATINGASVLTVTDPAPFPFGTVAVENDEQYGAFRIGSMAVSATIPPQATWQQLGGPDGGQIQAISIDPSNTSIIYAGAVHTGVMKSDNKGDFWREIGFTNGLAGTKANIVAVAPSNSSIVYASLEDSSTGGGASRSDDRGLHWRALSQGMAGYFVETLAVDPTNPNIVYLATENLAGSTLPVGLEKSVDGGNTFANILTAQVQSITISQSNPNTVYVATFTGVMRSDNGGVTWKPVTPAQTQGQPVNRVVIDPQNPNVAIAHLGGLNLAGRTCGPLFRTTDGGSTWNVISGDIQVFGQTPCSAAGWGLTDVVQSPTSTSTLYAIGNYANDTGVMFRSDDSGTTWRTLPGRMDADPQVVVVDPTDANTVYVGTFGDGVFRSTDGGATLTHLPTGFLGGGIYAIAVYPGNSNVIYASRSINGQGEVANGLGTLTKSVDGGVTWTDYAGPPFNIVYIAIDPVTPSTMYVATSGSLGSGTGLWKSTDGGDTWVQKNQGLTYMNLTTIAINPSNTNMILVGTGHRPYGGTVGDGIFKSTDGGNTWHKVTIPSLAVVSIVINPVSTNIMYAATMGGGVYKSTDSGETWSQSNSGIGNNDVYALAMNPQQPDTLYAGVNPFYADQAGPETNLAVFKTTDGAASWKNVLLDTDVEWIMLDPANPNNVYEGNHGGYISWSLDGGTTWSYGTDMIRKIGGHAYMWGSAVDPSVDALLVGTCGRGIFINHLATAETQTPIWLKVEYNKHQFSATFLSDATLSDFAFKPTAKSFVFTVTGTAGSSAPTNMSIPNNLLGGPYTITLDGSVISPTSTKSVPATNSTQMVLSISLNGKSQRLVVQGSNLVGTTTTTSTTSTSTTSSRTSSSSSAATTTTSTSSQASTTATPTTSTTSSPNVSTVPSSTVSTTIITSSAQTSSQTSSSGGGIPEFPVGLTAISLFSLAVVASYLIMRTRRAPLG